MNIEISEYEDCDINSLNIVLREAFNFEKKVNKKSSNIELVAKTDNTVIGYLVINTIYDSVQNIKYAHINYFCVLKEYRNKGIGYKLLQKALEKMEEDNISYIELTSNDNRKAAHHLYEKIGFKIRNTDVFRKEII